MRGKINKGHARIIQQSQLQIPRASAVVHPSSQPSRNDRSRYQSLNAPFFIGAGPTNELLARCASPPRESKDNAG